MQPWHLVPVRDVDYVESARPRQFRDIPRPRLSAPRNDAKC
jgi:hypothetical protein